MRSPGPFCCRHTTRRAPVSAPPPLHKRPRSVRGVGERNDGAPAVDAQSLRIRHDLTTQCFII